MGAPTLKNFETYMLSALMDALIAFARAGATGPTEIKLPERDYLWLASDLGIDDLTARPRVAIDPTPAAFTPEVSPEKHRLRTVRVGPSFVFQGPTGPVTITEAKI